MSRGAEMRKWGALSEDPSVRGAKRCTERMDPDAVESILPLWFRSASRADCNPQPGTLLPSAATSSLSKAIQVSVTSSYL